MAFFLGLASGYLFPADIALAQRNNRERLDEQRENQRVAQAEKALQQAKKELGESQKALQAQVKEAVASSQLVILAKKRQREAEENAEDRLGESLGIGQAAQAVKSARKQLEQVSKPILDQLHASPTWKEAQSAAEKAKITQQDLLADTELDDAQRNRQLKSLVEVLEKPADLDRQAILADSEGKKLSEQVDTLQAKLDKIRKSISPDKVSADKEVVQAKQGLAKAEEHERSMGKEVGKLRSLALKAQKEVALATQSLAKARAADAADPNRPKPKGKR
jgi:hypothetical protein